MKKLNNFQIICILFIIFDLIRNSLGLIFINNTFNFWCRILMTISIVYIFNTVICSEYKYIRTAAVIVSIITIIILSSYSLLFEDLLYSTEIKLSNGKSLIVKEHAKINNYVINFYDKKYFLLMKKIENSPSLRLDSHSFANGDYKIVNNNENEVTIKYKGNNTYETITLNISGL